jgi:hypothetical protein
VGVVDNSPKVQLILEFRSLLVVVFEEEAYLEYCHVVSKWISSKHICANAPVGGRLSKAIASL